MGGEQGKDGAALERLLAFMDAELRRLIGAMLGAPAAT